MKKIFGALRFNLSDLEIVSYMERGTHVTDISILSRGDHIILLKGENNLPHHAIVKEAHVDAGTFDIIEYSSGAFQLQIVMFIKRINTDKCTDIQHRHG